MYLGIILTLLVTTTQVLSTNYTPLFNDDVTEIHVVAGQTAVLPCTVLNKGDHLIIWMNPRRILFSREESIVIDDKRVGIISSPGGQWNLRINHVRYNDSGEYSCQINTKPVKIKRVVLHVQVPAHILNAYSSRDMDVLERSNVTLTCKSTGVPQPNITWFRRPFVAVESKEYLNTEGETLHIPDIRRFQGGYYVCLAYNGVPPAVTREMEVKVKYSPVVKLLNSKLGQSLGKETILECSVTSYPRSLIQWIKNGVRIDHSFKYRLELYPGKHDTHTLTLQISHINVHDYGDYRCVAENSMGKQGATMLLYEYKDPTPTTQVLTTTRRTTAAESEEYYYFVDPNLPVFVDNDYAILSDGSKYPLDEFKKGKHADKHYDKQGYIKSGRYGNASTAVRSCIYVMLLVLQLGQMLAKVI